MFAVTFLGHQGWVFHTERSCILVDPLLCEDFGHAYALEYRVFPPRVWNWAQFPKVDAVLLSHEHDDHFDLPSLSKLDRRIPIYLSSRSSTAGYKILCQMGFSVHPIVPGLPITVGDLQFLALCPDHVSVSCGDEWDTLPYMVRQADGDGGFFSMVDIPLTPGHVALGRNFLPTPGIVGWTNNALDWSHMANFKTERTEGTQEATVRMQAGLAMFLQGWGPPAAMAMCAGGFSFTGERAWLNRQIFCVDPEQVCKTVGQKIPQGRFVATRPGQTFVMEQGELKRVEKQAPFLTTTPPPTWPLRTKAPDKEIPDYGPATGWRVFDEKDLDRLHLGLAELAGGLFGSPLFRSLYSLLGIEGEGRALTFALCLRSGDNRRALVFEYNPTACAFEPSQAEDPQKAYLAGLECWATDFLAVLEGDLGPIALSFGRSRQWNAMPQRFNFALFEELYRHSHPLRRPVEFLRAYEKQLAALPAVAPTINFRT